MAYTETVPGGEDFSIGRQTEEVEVADREQIIRVGGVGTGRIFQHAHIRAYPRIIRKARLVGFYDLNPARAQQALEKYAAMLQDHETRHPEDAATVRENLAELRCYDSLDELLAHVDCIDVCTHARGRMAVAIAALERGVHAMVEKPMARTWIEADRARRVAAARPDVYLQLNDDNFYDPKYRIVHDLLRQGAIGKLQQMTMIRGSRLDSRSVLKAQASALDNGGGCLMDYGTHGLAGAWYVLGTHLRPAKVEAIAINVLFPQRVLEGDPYYLEVDDNARLKVLFEEPASGAWVTLFLEATWSGGHIGPDKEKGGGQNGGYFHLQGDEGVAVATATSRIIVTRWDGGETVLPLQEFEGETISVAQEIESFIDGIRAHRPPECDVVLGAEIIAIVEAAYLSALRGRAVTPDEFKDLARSYVARYGDNEQAEEALLSELLRPYRKKAD